MNSVPFIDESELIEGLSVAYMKFSGMWNIINEYKSTGKKNSTLKIACIICILLFCPFICLNMLSFLVLTVNLERATLLILNPLSQAQSLFKSLVFWYGIEKQCSYILVLKKNFLKCIPIEKNIIATKMYKKLAVTSNYFCIAAITANMTCVFVWNLLPVLRSKFVENYFHIKIYSKDKGPNKILGGWYPFPYTETPWAEMVYVYEFCVCFWAGLIITLYECLLIQLVLMLCAHISVLGYHISTLKTELMIEKPMSDNSMEYKETLNTILYDELINCIKDHQNLTRMGNEFKNFFNFLITMQLATGLLILIISVFHFIYGSKDWLFTFKFLVYLSYAFVEIVLYCYSGDILQKSSSDLSFSLYSSQWYELDSKFRKTGQMLMVRSKKPVSLIAVGLYPVNLITLTNILQLTYSSSALLSRMTT